MSATVTLTPTITPTSSTAEASTTAAPVASTTSHGLSIGAIAGIAIGGAAVLLLAAILLWFCGRRSSRRNNNGGIGDGAWHLGSRGSKQNPYSNGTSTPGIMPPAYNPHGMPVMTQQAKGYSNGIPTTSVVEHYNLNSSGSPAPPAQISPHYNQQNFPPHILDPAAFNHNYSAPYSVMTTGQPRTSGHFHQQQPQHFIPPPQPGTQNFRSEIYSGTPAPRAAQPISMSTSTSNHNSAGHYSGVPTASTADHRTSMSMSANSRVGSPDNLAEMNAARSQAGTLNHGGGGALQQPVPIRGGGDLGVGVRRVDS